MDSLKDSPFYGKFIQLNEELCEYDKYAKKYKTAKDLINWYVESATKNRLIFKSKKEDDLQNNETFKKYRQHVYWINLGANIGSEFGGYHYAVVLHQTDTTAVIIPLTSKKKKLPGWLIGDDTIVDIGPVRGKDGIEVAAYACISRIQSVSKKRLDRCGNKHEGYVDIKLSDAQMDLIDKMVVKTLIHDEQSVNEMLE